MTPVILKYTKRSVRKAGDHLANKDTELDDYFTAFDILDNWRASHAYPMQSMLGYFRNKAFDADPKAIVARRLKRTPSILAKLKRESGMKLDRMEDIGGVRIVVDSLTKVHAISESIKNGRTRNILRRERDYINFPKDSGYRGVHLIYRYNGSKEGFPCHNIELQIRTEIQHAWATTVEVVGTFTRQGLKASKGSDQWLDFFRLAGDVFATIEKGVPKTENNKDRDRLIKKANQLGVLEKLQAYAVTIRYMNDKPRKGDRYFMMILNASSGGIRIGRFPSLERASAAYAKREKELRDSDDEDVVLVSTESIKTLKLAYPNYFADTSQFRQHLRKLMANKSQQTNR